MMLTLLIICAFIIWFSSIWIAVLSLLSFIGGWKKLSRLYPASSSDINAGSKKYKMSSIKMGFASYRSCVHIGFTERGISLEVMKIFSIMHKPLFIPFDKISEVQKGKFIIDYTSFKVDGKKITFYGKAGDELFSRISARHAK